MRSHGANGSSGASRRQLLQRPSTWRTLAADTAWRVRHRPAESPPPTWPVSTAEAARVVLRWPVKYEWAPARLWVDPLRVGLGRLVQIVPTEIPQPYGGIVMLEAELDGQRHEIAIDYSDDAELQDECLDRSSVYFKMQFLHEGYGNDTVVAGGFVPAGQSVYRFLTPLREMRRRTAAVDVYGRFGLAHATDIRRRAVGLLREQTRLSYRGSDGLVLYTQHLRDIAQSRVCVDLPGRGALCHRLVDCLAVGASVVGPRPRTRLHVPLEEGRHVTYVGDDLDGLIDACAALVSDSAVRERRYRETSEFFDRYLHRDQLGGYYLRTLLDRLTSR